MGLKFWVPNFLINDAFGLYLFSVFRRLIIVMVIIIYTHKTITETRILTLVSMAFIPYALAILYLPLYILDIGPYNGSNALASRVHAVFGNIRAITFQYDMNREYHNFRTNVDSYANSRASLDRGLESLIQKLRDPNCRDTLIWEDLALIKYISTLSPYSARVNTFLGGLSNGREMYHTLNRCILNWTQRQGQRNSLIRELETKRVLFR